MIMLIEEKTVADKLPVGWRIRGGDTAIPYQKQEYGTHDAERLALEQSERRAGGAETRRRRKELHKKVWVQDTRKSTTQQRHSVLHVRGS